MGIGHRSGGGNGWHFDLLVKAIKHGGNGVYRLLPRAERQRVAGLLAAMPAHVEQTGAARRHYSDEHWPSRSCAFCRAECIGIAIVDKLSREAKTKGGSSL